MKQYLSRQVIWLTPTKEQIALDGKSIAIFYPGQAMPVEATLHIQAEDSEGRSATKYYASVWQVSLSPVDEEWSNSSLNLPTDVSRRWERFLSQDTLDLIHRNASEQSKAELAFDLPSDSAPDDR